MVLQNAECAVMVSFKGIDGQNYGKINLGLKKDGNVKMDIFPEVKKQSQKLELFTLKKNRCKVTEACLQILRASRLCGYRCLP